MSDEPNPNSDNAGNDSPDLISERRGFRREGDIPPTLRENGYRIATAESGYRLPTKQRGDILLVFTVTVCALAVLLESFAHILAHVFADPLPHFGYLAAYCLAIIAPIYVARVVKSPAPAAPERAVAIAANALSLLMAGVMSVGLLPIAPFAVVGIALFGFGLLGLSPYFLLWLSLRQFFELRRQGKMSGVVALPATAVWGTAATLLATAWVLFVQPFVSGVLLARVVDVPNVSPCVERQTADALSSIGGENALLILSYRTPLPLWERAGVNIARTFLPLRAGHYSRWDEWYYGGFWVDTTTVKQARRLFYLSSGKAFGQGVVPWSISNHRSEQWVDDIAAEDVGGTRVGRNAPGVSLESETGSATVNPRSATGTADMILVFANATDTASEARAEILLPPGAVCHQASLWINGTERPAAFGASATVRRAYTQVAVVEQRDPLLITMPVPGKLLVQCFPIPAHGKMKIRLGVTFPLSPDPSDQRKLSLALPAWGAVNFAGAGVLADALPVRDALTGQPPVLPLMLAPGTSWSAKAQNRQPVRLLVVVDESAGMGDVFPGAAQTALANALANLPTGSTVQYVRPDNQPPSRFYAGHDNVPYLAQAVNRADADTVLYLHAGMPEAVSDAAPLALAMKSLPALPNTGKVPPALCPSRLRFVSLLLKPNAPDTIGDRLAMQENARALSAAQYGSAKEAVTAAVETAVRGETLPSLAGKGFDVSQLRLSQYRDALAVWYKHNNFGTEALAAAKIVAAARLVTPLSGAVVLETQEDYRRNGLDDGTDGEAEKENAKSKAEKSTTDNAKNVTKLITPEPGTWVLIVLGGAAALALARRKFVGD